MKTEVYAWKAAKTELPVSFRGISCSLMLNEAEIDLYWPERFPAGRKENEIALYLKPETPPYLWNCSDPAADAVFDESLEVYLSFRLEIPESKLTPSSVFTRPLLGNSPIESHWNIQNNHPDQAFPAQLWINALIIEQDDQIADILTGSQSPLEQWSWLVKSIRLETFSLFGLPYDLIRQALFLSLGLGTLILIATFLIRRIARRNAD